jgi:hypothetical protein
LSRQVSHAVFVFFALNVQFALQGIDIAAHLYQAVGQVGEVFLGLGEEGRKCENGDEQVCRRPGAWGTTATAGG